MKDVKALKLPDTDDAFAKTASEFDTMDALRADLSEKVREVKEREVEGVIRDRVLQAMVDTVDVDLPDSLIEDETTHQADVSSLIRYSLGLPVSTAVIGVADAAQLVANATVASRAKPMSAAERGEL